MASQRFNGINSYHTYYYQNTGQYYSKCLVDELGALEMFTRRLLLKLKELDISRGCITTCPGRHSRITKPGRDCCTK